MKTNIRSPQKGATKKSGSNNVEHLKLMKLFEDEIKDITWAENALTQVLPKMAKTLQLLY